MDVVFGPMEAQLNDRSGALCWIRPEDALGCLPYQVAGCTRELTGIAIFVWFPRLRDIALGYGDLSEPERREVQLGPGRGAWDPSIPWPTIDPGELLKTICQVSTPSWSRIKRALLQHACHLGFEPEAQYIHAIVDKVLREVCTGAPCDRELGPLANPAVRDHLLTWEFTQDQLSRFRELTPSQQMRVRETVLEEIMVPIQKSLLVEFMNPMSELMQLCYVTLLRVHIATHNLHPAANPKRKAPKAHDTGGAAKNARMGGESDEEGGE